MAAGWVEFYFPFFPSHSSLPIWRFFPEKLFHSRGKKKIMKKKKMLRKTKKKLILLFPSARGEGDKIDQRNCMLPFSYVIYLFAYLFQRLTVGCCIPKQEGWKTLQSPPETWQCHQFPAHCDNYEGDTTSTNVVDCFLWVFLFLSLLLLIFDADFFFFIICWQHSFSSHFLLKKEIALLWTFCYKSHI